MSKTTKPLPTYDGPSLKEVQAYNLAKVNLELTRLKVEPRRSLNIQDESNLIALLSEQDLDDFKATWTPGEVEQLRMKAKALDLLCWQGQILSAYLKQWAAALTDADAWRIVESGQKDKVSISEKRYTPRDVLTNRVAAVIYQREVAKDDA
jgi:hypothetical protein